MHVSRRVSVYHRLTETGQINTVPRLLSVIRVGGTMLQYCIGFLRNNASDVMFGRNARGGSSKNTADTYPIGQTLSGYIYLNANPRTIGPDSVCSGCECNRVYRLVNAC